MSSLAIIRNKISVNSIEKICLLRIYCSGSFFDYTSKHSVLNSDEEIFKSVTSKFNFKDIYSYNRNNIGTINRNEIPTNYRLSFSDKFDSLFRYDPSIEREDVRAFVDSCFLEEMNCSYTCIKLVKSNGEFEYVYKRIPHVNSTYSEYFGILEASKMLKEYKIRGNILTDSSSSRQRLIQEGITNVLWVPRDDDRIRDVDLSLRAYIRSRSHLV